MSGSHGLETWMGRDVASLRAQWGVPLLQIHERVASTNDVARELAHAQAPSGATVIANLQSRGRGRRGREWIATPGSSLLLSMVLKPGTPGAEALLSIRLGLAAARAIESITPLAVGLKWPNDLFVHGFKVGGILCEGASERGRSLFMVAGIGINVSQTGQDWPADLRATASSLEQRLGHPVDRVALAGAVIAQWLGAGDREAARLTDDEIEAFRRRDLLFGHELFVDDHRAGVGQGIDTDGALRVRTPDGAGEAVRRVIAGTVRSPALLAGDRS